MRLNEATRQFYFWLINSGHTRTAKIYRSVLEELPNADLTEITPQLLEAHASQWDVKAATANLRKSAIRAFFAWAVENDWINKSPARLLKDQKTIQAEARYLSVEEVARFREVIKGRPRDELLFSIYLMCGARLTEILRLAIKDAASKAVVTITGKGSKTRQIFLNGYLTVLVKIVAGDRPDADPLFVSALGRRLSASRVQALLKDYCDKAGIKRISPHGLRHTFLTVLYARTKDLRLCQEAAGHSSVQTTMRYCHVDGGQLQQAVCGLYQ